MIDLSSPETRKIIEALPRADRERLFLLAKEKQRRDGQKSFYAVFPDRETSWAGPKTEVFSPGEKIWPRDRYLKHLEFFEAGASYLERCFMAANRVGKTISGGYEDVCHATGLYPSWWKGRRFSHPTSGWIAGKTNETTRDILQRKIFGKPIVVGGKKTMSGTGLMPGDRILDCTWKQGVSNLLDTVYIRHESGEASIIGVKSYQQGPDAFEGEEKDWIHLDEEPPRIVYDECLFRTATTKGLIYLTFTPLQGMSDVVLAYMPGGADTLNA